MAEYLRLGFAAQQNARTEKLGVHSIVVITNANDSSVDNNITAQFVDSWQAHDEDYLSTYQFEKQFGLPHDLISPTREDGDPAMVYPIIIDKITIAE